MLFGKEHVERYRATEGAEGHIWLEGSHVLLLTTTGRKSGQERVTPLIYGESGDDLLVVASNGGGDPPAWFLNLQADPSVKVQVLGDEFSATARIATASEKPEMWATMLEQWQHYDVYQENADREIPVVVLERA